MDRSSAYICDRCGFRYPRLRREWTGLMVCDADYDHRPPDHYPPNIYPEGLPRRDARPYPPDVFVDTSLPPNWDDL